MLSQAQLSVRILMPAFDGSCVIATSAVGGAGPTSAPDGRHRTLLARVGSRCPEVMTSLPPSKQGHSLTGHVLAQGRQELCARSVSLEVLVPHTSCLLPQAVPHQRQDVKMEGNENIKAEPERGFQPLPGAANT